MVCRGREGDRERKDKTEAMQKLVIAARGSESVPGPRTVERKQQDGGAKEGEGKRDAGRLAGSSRLFTFLKLCSGATSSSQLSSARRR